MNIVEFTEFLVKSLVSNVDSVSVKEFDSDEENTILIQVLVDNNDMGKVIGKGGKVANSIRSLVQASSYLKENKKVKINIDSF
ncbi:MAG: KH domain-containing protein [bacterium]|nr:KH domain-containing protein [bacterium]